MLFHAAMLVLQGITPRLVAVLVRTAEDTGIDDIIEKLDHVVGSFC